MALEYFKPKSPNPTIGHNIGDNALATLSELNVLVDAINKLTISGAGSPGSLSIVPEFVGQTYIDTTGPNIYMSTSLTDWVGIYFD